jgi:hypothetical protein
VILGFSCIPPSKSGEKSKSNTPVVHIDFSAVTVADDLDYTPKKMNKWVGTRIFLMHMEWTQAMVETQMRSSGHAQQIGVYVTMKTRQKNYFA